MLRLIFWFLIVAALAWGLTWLAAQPGSIAVEWLGYHIEVPMAVAVVAALLGLFALYVVFKVLRWLIGAPFAITDYFRLRRRRKAAESMTTGLTALLAGDANSARKAAQKAAQLAPADPMARLLQAQAALKAGDDKHAEYLFRQLIEDERTESAALHGLYELALRKGDEAAALAIAGRAHAKYPALEWAAKALLHAAARKGDWRAAQAILQDMKNAGLLDKQQFARLQTVTLTAQARQLEETEPAQAAELALRAHKQDKTLVPAAIIAARLLARQEKFRKAEKILETTWKLSPHPDIAEVYAYLKPGASPRDRLNRVRLLAEHYAPGGEEGAVALARAAIDAKDWEMAEKALKPMLEDNPSARIYLLMAELEEGRSGDIGRAREWLTRARRARPGPAWVAGNIVAREWQPATPDGEIGAFEWKEPPRELAGAALLAAAPAPEAGEAPQLPAASPAIEIREAPADTNAENAAAPATAEAEKTETAQAAAGQDKTAKTAPANANAAKSAKSADGDSSGGGDGGGGGEGRENAGDDTSTVIKPPPGAEAVAEVSHSEEASKPPLPDDPGVGASRKA